MAAGDVCASHNLTLHAACTNRRADRVRWSIGHRYINTDAGFGWHKAGAHFNAQFPIFVAAIETRGPAQSYEEWHA